MVNAWDVQVLNLEQRSRTAGAKPLAHPHAQTIGEMTTDLILSTAYTTGQTYAKLEHKNLAQKTQELLASSDSGAEFQAKFDEQIRPETIYTALLDPIGASNLISDASHAAKMTDIKQDNALKAMNENLTMSTLTKMMSWSSNIDQWNNEAEKILRNFQEDQGISPEMSLKIDHLRANAPLYFQAHANKERGVSVSKIADNFTIEALNYLGEYGASSDLVDGFVADFEAQVLPAARPENREGLKKTFIKNLAGSLSDSTLGVDLVAKNEHLFTPQEREEIRTKVLINDNASKNLKASARKDVNQIIKSRLENGQTSPYRPEHGFNIDPDLLSYNDFLQNNKENIAKIGIGPQAYSKYAASLPDTAENQFIKSGLYSTSAHLSTSYQDDFFGTIADNADINLMQRNLASSISFSMPEIDPETGSIVDVQPMVDSLARGCDFFAKLKSAYFPGDKTINDMISANTRNSYKKVYNTLNDNAKWDFVNAGIDALDNQAANLQGMWRHRQIARLTNDPEVAGFSLLGASVGKDVGRSAFLQHLAAKSAKGADRTKYNSFYERARDDIERVNPNLTPQMRDEFAALAILDPSGSFRKVTSGKYAYIKDSGWFGNSKLHGLMFLGNASATFTNSRGWNTDAEGALAERLSSLNVPGTSYKAWELVNNEVTFSNGKKYRGALENLAGSLHQYNFYLIDENGKRISIPGSVVTINPVANAHK